MRMILLLGIWVTMPMFAGCNIQPERYHSVNDPDQFRTQLGNDSRQYENFIEPQSRPLVGITGQGGFWRYYGDRTETPYNDGRLR